MPLPTLVDATDLLHWARRRDSQGRLPQLVRRLIHATVDEITRISFPAGESVQTGGWDGSVVVGRGNHYVPSGVSAWELSVEEKVKGKADDDYTKRLRAPRGVDPPQTTFVFATLRRWGEKDRWIAARRREGKWRDVLVWDADDFEQWLELAPAVGIWLATLLGKRPDDTRDLGGEWEDWSEGTRPTITPEFILAGRDAIAEAIHQWLRSPSDPLALKAESRGEALAVFMAALHLLPLDERVAHLSRSLIVRSPQSWHRLTASPERLILVPEFESPEALTRATRAGHRVIVPLGQADSAASTTLLIPPLSKENATKALIASGVDEDRAQEFVTLARKSFTSFRRQLAIVPELHQPAWSRPVEGRSLVPALLAGAWDDSKDGDRQVLATLAQVPYEDATQAFVRWSNESDPPVRRVGDTWFIVSKADAWQLLSPYLTRDDLERLERVVMDVLGGPDPRYDTPAAKRWMAGAFGSTPPYSRHIHRGLADTLAVMGARGAATSVGAGSSISDHAARIVRGLLKRANGDWRIWASLSPVLPLLAEAAPDVFLSEVEAGLSGEHPVLVDLFTDQESDAMFSDSPHTGLLSALETIAWDPERLGPSALLLAGLARIDPGGRLANRPKASLRGIFLLWRPETAATLSQRLVVLDMLRDRQPNMAWQLTLHLILERHEVGFPTARPDWREWFPDPRQNITRRELAKATQEVAARLVDDAAGIGSRWRDLIEILPMLPKEQYEAAVERLAAMDIDRLQPSDIANIWDALRRMISRHRSFPEAGWALSAERLDPLEPILSRFEPTDPIARFGWLFGNNPELLQSRGRDWRAGRDALGEARLSALRSIHAEAGLTGVLHAVPHVEQPGEIGFALGVSELGSAEENEVLHQTLGAEDHGWLQFGRGLIGGRLHSQGEKWVEEKLFDPTAAWSPSQRAELLAFLPKTGRTWDVVEKSGPEVEQHYWRLVGPYRFEDADVQRAVRQFLKHGRPYSATDLLAFHVSRAEFPPVDFITNTLERLIQVLPGDERISQTFSHDLAELLDTVTRSQTVDQQRVAKLEWAFLPLLSRFDRTPRLLHRELGRDPDFFIQVISLVFRAEGEEPRGLTPEEEARAQRGYELLDSWQTIPGMDEHGQIDPKALKAWVERARDAAAAIKRLSISDEMIGKVLSTSPIGPDGHFPHPAVRDVIEHTASRDLDRGFEIGVYNSRGTIRKDPMEGGIQERQLTAKYEEYAKAITGSWPRTATLLRNLAAGYQREALHEDQRAQLREGLNTW